MPRRNRRRRRIVPRIKSLPPFIRKFFQSLFVKLFKSLAPGRAAGGIFNLCASGGKGGEATVTKMPLIIVSATDLAQTP